MIEYSAIGMIYTAVQTTLLACIRYWLYQDNLRVPAKWMYAIVATVSVGGAFVWIGIGGFRGISFATFRIIIAVMLFIVSCITIKEPFAKHAYTYSYIIVYDSVLELTSAYAQHMTGENERGIVFTLTASLLLAVSFIPSVRYLKRMINQLTMLENNRMWQWLCVISFSFVFMNLLFTYPIQEYAPKLLISRYLMMAGIIGLYVASVQAMQAMSDSAKLNAELSLIKQRVNLQQSHYERIVAQMDEVRRMRHDLRHHRTVLSALAENGDISAIREYLSSATAVQDAIPVTGNLAADSVLLYYLDIAQSLKIRFDLNLSIDTEIPVSDSDLCIILGNLLENAVDAQEYVAEDIRYICLSASGSNGNLTIAIDNSFDGTVKLENGKYLSRKQGDEHGIGLSSVKSVCEKYGGVLQIEAEEKKFMVGVVIGF